MTQLTICSLSSRPARTPRIDELLDIYHLVIERLRFAEEDAIPF
jgi:hypothetical protein